MELDYCGDEKIQDPSLDEVFERLTRLTDNVNSFLILAREEQRYIQTIVTETGFHVEYRDGSEAEHYSTPRSDLRLDEVMELFALYYKGDPAFRDAGGFTRGVEGAKQGCLSALLLGPFL